MGGKRRFLCSDWLLYVFVIGLVSLALGLSVPVFAEDAKDKDNEEEFTLEEVTVTAEKREAELQKVPMDIAVVRPDDMERLNIHQMTELMKVIPDLESSNSTDGYGNIELKIRGVNMDYWNVTAETTVAVSIDGVSLPRSNALEGKFYDLERVEMLKGPQGTLYGRGATAGSLAMVSKKPDIGEFGGNIQLEYGSYDRRRIEGALNIPATDKLAFRLSGRTVRRGAYDDINISTQDMWGGRVAIRWEPDDRKSMNITVDTDSTNNKGGSNFQGAYFETFGDLKIVANDDPNLTEAFREVAKGGNVSTPYKAAWYFLDDVSGAKTRTDSRGFSMTYNQEFDFAWWTLKAGYRSSETSALGYRTGSPSLRPKGATIITSWYAAATIDPETGVITPAGTGPEEEGLGYVNWTRYSTYSAPRYATDGVDQWGRPYEEGDQIPETELILVPPAMAFNNVNMKTVTSAHSSDFETYLTSKESIANGDKYQWIAGTSLLNDYVLNETFIGLNTYTDQNLREYALYGEGSYELFSGLSLSAGYRHVWDTKSWIGYRFTENYRESSPTNDFFTYAYYEKDHSLFNNFEYKVDYDYYKFNIQWQATDDIMPYIQYSKGMKTINIDRFTGNAIPPEQLNSLEGGVKSRLFNGRLQVNLSGYYYEYKNKNTFITSYQCRVKNYNDNGTPDDTSDDYLTGCKQLGDVADNDVDYVHYNTGYLSPGGAIQHGGAANITWVITPNDRFDVTASYQHNEYDDYYAAKAMREQYEPLWGEGNVHSAELPANQVNKKGDLFGGRPWRGNFTYSHMWFLGADVLNMTLQGFYEGDAIDDVRQENTPQEYRYPGSPNYWTFDLSFNYSSTKWVPEGYRWTARLYSNNVLDSQALSNRRYNDDYNTQWKYAPNSGYISGSFITPRTLGLQFTLNF